MVVYLLRVHAWFPAFLLPRWRNGGAIAAVGGVVSVEIHCVAAVALCVSGVSNPDFTNFTKHSTVLTYILQQINTLYQHFPSVKTAKPVLEQAKTMLKIALHTFKNDENHTQNSKIHIQNSVCDVRCGECGGGFLHFCCQGGEFVVDFGGWLCGCWVLAVWFLYDCVANGAFRNL